MKTLQFHVRAALPERLQPLWTLARNVWWSWNPDAIALFRRINPDAYLASGPCPLKLLNTLPANTWEELANDSGFLEHLDIVMRHFRSYTESGTGREIKISEVKNSKGLIAYFSMEYGLHSSIPLYSGGLGVLAGDHLKTASDLKLPLMAVGLFYNQGYFRQGLNRDGWQFENYETNDPFYMPMELVTDAAGSPVRVVVQIAGQEVKIQVWRLDVGNIPLVLLDTDIPDNPVDVRKITSTLYGGGQDLRIQQELVLAIGGVRALYAMGVEPTVFHLNEGHSAFLTLERINVGVRRGMSWKEALLNAKGSQVFTVHTPVPAGNDVFPAEKVRRYIGDIEKQYRIPAEEFFTLGRPPENAEEFSMPVFAIRTSSVRNGVSKLHQKVSQRIWKPLWPQLNENEVPILGVTNGVHTRTWVSLELAEIFDRYLGKGWEARIDDEKLWERFDTVPDSEIWDVHMKRKSRMISAVIRAVNQSKRGIYGYAAELKRNLRPDILTLGFARRFASYKRGALIFRDMARLKRIIMNERFPVQILIAGKAHPRDNHGKEIIQFVCNAIEREGLASRVVFLEDYDMNLAERLVRGVDVWINTPIRGLEASGTSGMKVAINGGLNASILDGWWDEGYDGTNGFAIGERVEYPDERTRDQIEADTFYDMIEHQLVPIYYGSAVPTEWIKRMKGAIKTCCPRFSAQRMVLDYVENAYRPAQAYAEKWDPASPEKLQSTHNLFHDTELLQSRWNQLQILELSVVPGSTVNVGQTINVKLTIKAPFPENWLHVVLMRMELPEANSEAYGDETEVVRLHLIGRQSNDIYIYAVELRTANPGVRNYSVRLTPSEEIFPNALDLQLVKRYE